MFSFCETRGGEGGGGVLAANDARLLFSKNFSKQPRRVLPHRVLDFEFEGLKRRVGEGCINFHFLSSLYFSLHNYHAGSAMVAAS